MKKQIFYIVEKDNKYLCGVENNCLPYFGKRVSASRTTNKLLAEQWAKDYGGKVIKDN